MLFLIYNFNILKFIYDINIIKKIKKILLSKNKFNLKKILGTQFRAAPKLDDGTSLFFFLFCSFSSKKKKKTQWILMNFTSYFVPDTILFWNV
jgi:hypothetical protein